MMLSRVSFREMPNSVQLGRWTASPHTRLLQRPRRGYTPFLKQSLSRGHPTKRPCHFCQRRCIRRCTVYEGNGVQEPVSQPQRSFHEAIPVDSTTSLPPVVVQAKVANPSGGWFGTLLLILLVTVGTVSATFTAFMLYLRPTLKSIEDACKATEKASSQLGSAAIELEEAAIMFDEKLPPALKSVEQASREFEELGQSLNSLSGGLLSRRPARHRRRGRDVTKEPPSEETKMEAAMVAAEPDVTHEVSSSQNITRQTMDSIGRVASDITSFTRNFRPAMDMWRKRLTSIVTAVEADRRTETAQAQLAAPAVTAAQEEGEVNGLSTMDVIEGVSIEVESRHNNGMKSNDFVDEDDYGDLSELSVEDLFKDKDSLIAKIASESTGDAASEIMDALYKAEQAAEDAARASGDLQKAVERARNSGDWEDDPISWGDETADGKPEGNEFFEPDYSGAIKPEPASIAKGPQEGETDQETK